MRGILDLDNDKVSPLMFVTTLIHVTFVDPKIRFYKYRTYALTDLMFLIQSISGL